MGLRLQLGNPNIPLAFVVTENGRFATLPITRLAYGPMGLNWTILRPLLSPGALDDGSILSTTLYRCLASLLLPQLAQLEGRCWSFGSRDRNTY